MRDDEEIDKFLDDLLSGTGVQEESKIDLRELFEKRIEELDMKTYHVLNHLNIAHRTLTGILDGTQKTANFISFVKLARFLKIDESKAFEVFIDQLKENYPDDFTEVPLPNSEVSFLKQHFDLAAYQSFGLIKDKKDYKQAAIRLSELYGLKNIFDYRPPMSNVAFSAGARAPKNELVRINWIHTVEEIFKPINNPNSYSRERLLEYFPKIRGYTRDVNTGLIKVIQELYKIGVTVLLFKPFDSLHLRGSTCVVNSKPCVVITDYVGNYATLWFALIHELFHVLFDWDSISKGNAHLSYDTGLNEPLVDDEEKMANDFARKYLYSKEKTELIRSVIRNSGAVEKYATLNDVHPSLIYTFHAYDQDKKNTGWAWALARSKNPDFKALFEPFEMKNPESILFSTYAKSLIKKIYCHNEI